MSREELIQLTARLFDKVKGLQAKIRLEKVIRTANDVIIDKNSWWYKNCKTQRARKAKICSECPFRFIIEKQERNR